MSKIEFSIIDRSMIGMLIGFSYLPKNDAEDYSEINIYLLLIVLHFKIY